MKQIAKNSTEYWARRKAEFVVSQLDKAEDTAEIMKQTYAKAQKHLVDQADKIFLKYQRDYKLSETQARAILKRSGVDVMKLKRELQNGVQSDEIKQILTDMDSAAYASRIEKLIQSQKDIDNLMLGMSKNDNKLLTNHLKNIADDSYLHEMFMLQKRAKVAFEFGSLDPAYVDKLLHVNWSGKHFSQAIWNNHAELGQTLKEEYLVNYLTGRSSFDMAKVIEYRFGVEGYKARRLVRTESTFFSAELEAKAYEEAGIEQYEYVSVLDDRTTHVCKSKDGKIYNVKDRRAGVNYPPLHVFCRATTIAHIPNEWLEEVDGDVFDDKIVYKDFKKGLPNNHQLMYNRNMKNSGGIHGAWNSKTDPDEIYRNKHAETYYESVRKRNTKNEITKIAQNTGFSQEDILVVYNHIFENKYVLGGVHKRFDPDYDMAISWERLFSGKNIQEHDLILFKHELMESKLMSQGVDYDTAHGETQKKYDYLSALIKWKIERGDY